ncbi:MAG: hypothetical protein ACOYKM_05265 [Caulobacterales bacterium]|jgi:tetratricopeptide (TPR) repeat protein
MLIAAALVQLALSQAPLATDPDEAWLTSCVARIETAAEAAYEDGMQWSSETRRPAGWRCAAMALIEMGRVGEGARRLEALGSPPDAGPPNMRAEILSQAGNAWLMAGDGLRAQATFSRAIQIMASDPEVSADLLIDRARAFAMQGDWRLSEEDLSRSLDLRPNDPLALRLRAVARMNQNAFDLAEADAQAAALQAPTDIETLLVLGQTREARRTGVAVVPQ